MASLIETQGYPYSLFLHLDYYMYRDYLCKQCKHVAREPNITTCCGECFCKACIDVVIQDKKPCPGCKDSHYKAVKHVMYKARVQALKVRCKMKDRGCEWTGQLQHLDAHLDVTAGDCRFTRSVDKLECPNRDSICSHCKFRATFREVYQHFEVCQFYPLVCPNKCGMKIERKALADHLEMCTVETACDFSYFGCEAKLLSKDKDKHMEQNTQRHLALMAAATLKLKKEFEQRLKKRDIRIRALEIQIREKRMKLQQLQEELLSEVNRIRSNKAVPPYDIVLEQFTEKRELKKMENVPPMYTHIGGYNFTLGIYTNGAGVGSGTHVSIHVTTHTSRYDAVLKCPAKFTMTAQLLNQHRDQDHFTRDIQCEIKHRGIGHIGGDWTFIRLADLGWNDAKQTQYLKDDCLRFRITKIVIQK